jgi:single-strand DNA-binding protein
MLIFTLAGNLGKDAETRSANGKSVISFSVAVNRKVKDETGNYTSRTIWVDCLYYPPVHSSIANYLKKGQAVSIMGRGDMEQYYDKTGTQRYKLSCMVNELTLQGYAGAMPENGKEETHNRPTTPAGVRENAVNNNPPDNDLPF